MFLTFYRSVAEELKVRKSGALFPAFGVVTGEKMIEGAFSTPAS